MLGLFGAVKDRLRLKIGAHCIDNWVFQLHYRATSIILLLSTILVTSREYFGDHISCITDMKKDGFNKVVQNFCFFTSTFTVVDENFYRYGEVAHPGIHPYGIGSKQNIKHHYYYQWVPFFLFGQSIMFYLTHMLWKKVENGRIKTLLHGLDYSAFAVLEKEVTVDGKAIPTRKKKEICINRIKDAFVQRIILNKSWALWFIFCEILNFLNVIFQVFLTNKFLGGEFYSLGSNLIKNGFTTLHKVFPKITKCTFHTYGHSGSIQNHDALCVMALNIINEKIYIFLWFWFAVLFTASSMILLWRLASLFLYSRSVDFNRLIFGTHFREKMYFWHINMITKHFNYPDWLLLKYLSKNMDSLAFRELFLSLSDDLEEKKPLMFMLKETNYGFSNIDKFE